MAPVVLITGCSLGGIGHAMCEAFAERGCTVIATSRNVSTMGDFKHETTIKKFALDVTQDEQVKEVVQQVVEQEGGIDILVNNAGMIAPGPLIDNDIEHVQRAFDTNVFGLWRMARAVIPEMAKRHKGLIVNIGSIVGEIPTPWNGIYCSTKAAVYSLSEVMNMECRPFGISVMHVAPGAVKSNIADNAAAQYALPPSSLYKAYLPNIVKRMYASQGPGSMSTEKFAEDVVSKALKTSPPSYMMGGGLIRMFSVAKWLPRGLLLSVVWWMLTRKDP
ncbi:oxidoreductase [Amanita rubescens]|nr:oxidoreductase [Amanita rubescens]